MTQDNKVPVYARYVKEKPNRASPENMDKIYKTVAEIDRWILALKREKCKLLDSIDDSFAFIEMGIVEEDDRELLSEDRDGNYFIRVRNVDTGKVDYLKRSELRK